MDAKSDASTDQTDPSGDDYSEDALDRTFEELQYTLEEWGEDDGEEERLVEEAASAVAEAYVTIRDAKKKLTSEKTKALMMMSLDLNTILYKK